ncbi:MAG TPA: carbohydrate ABC transporter permease [Acidimicrobiales bacterium]|nr:carbohydrate ABC transporter permease [Acidimicrobiales bacterium]
MKLLQHSRRAVILVVLGIVFLVPLLFPVYWIISASVQNLSTIFAKAPSLLPGSIFGQNYQYAFNNIIGNIGVSLLIALCVVALSWLLGVPAAHALARRGGRLTAAVVLAMLITQMIPGISLSIALYQIFQQWGLLGSYIGLILADSAGAVPFVILVVRAFMAGIPRELYDAAAVDGAGPLRSFWRVSVPLAVPAIMTVGLFSFLGAWGDFVNALTLNATGGPQPLTLGLYKFVQQHSTDLGAIFAATVIAAVPTTIILFVGQRWIKGGLRAGALKG